METHERRNLLAIIKNPNRRLDYLVSFDAPDLEDGLSLRIRYVPDLEIVPGEALEAYMAAVTPGWQETSLEAFAAMVMEDINNELVPRWVQVVAVHQEDNDAIEHSVILEDHQPQWNNSFLLGRLERS